jgi:glycerol-3-phosphate acyltransferase PlsY
MLLNTLLIVGAYLLGSVACAVLTCRLMGLPDPRMEGSGNPGATNVLRLGGRKAAAITLAGDVLKGLLPVILARLLGAGPGVIGAVAVAAFLGHLYPLYFGFKGGKGVATAAGALLGLAPWVALAVVTLWLAVAILFRYASLAGICAAAAAPLLAWLLGYPAAVTLATLVMGAALVWRHRSNIERLLAGTEGRIGVGPDRNVTSQ